VSAGTAGTVSVSGSKTQQLTTQAAKTVVPTESEQTAVASGVYTTGAVKVGAISSTYVGSDIAQNDSDDLTASGATVTVPAGYYAETASKSVATTTHPNPTASVNSTTGLVTASHTQGTGYVTGGTTTGTMQLSTQAAATITPSTSQQTAVAAGKYTTGAVTVDPIPSEYIIPTGTIQIDQNGTIDVTQYASAEVNVSGGVTPVTVEESDVNFIDYDGTILYSYTASDFATGHFRMRKHMSRNTVNCGSGKCILPAMEKREFILRWIIQIIFLLIWQSPSTVPWKWIGAMAPRQIP